MSKLVLIDGHSILNRAFFGIRDLTNSEGLHTNAIYGFLNILFKLLDEEQPEYLTVVFDRSEPTFRHKMYSEYKGNRSPMAEELKGQVPVMKEVLSAMGIATAEMPGYEADDILGTLSRKAEAQGLTVRIVSGDRDLLQLATDTIKVRIPKTKQTGTEIEDYYAADVVERYQVTPTEYIDVKALMGDSSDNIPGVPGIGEKGATTIIGKYHNIENAYAHVDEITPAKAQKGLAEHYNLAQLSKELATIRLDAPVDFDPASATVGDFYTPEAYLMFRRLEFKQMLARFDDANRAKSTVGENFQSITDAAAQEAFLAEEGTTNAAVVFLEEGGELFGVAVAQPAGNVCETDVPENSNTGNVGETDAIGSPGSADAGGTVSGGSPGAADEREVSVAFIPCGSPLEVPSLTARIQRFCDSCAAVIAPDLKVLLKYVSVSADKGQDTNLMAYLLNPLKNEYAYDDLAQEMLGEMLPARTDLIGKANLKKAAAEQPEGVAKLACFTAYTSYRAVNPLSKQLAETGMEKLYREVELPLVYVLHDMEQAGVCVDGDALREYGEELSVRISELEQSIYEKAGEEFNINSPKQLGVILFEKLGMPNGKKTKTGYSTAADVLEKLAPEYPIVSEILEYRQMTKLRSTYAEGLGTCIGPDGRIHTTFHQTVTATGRLSSTEPNLQNIPIRMEMGKRFRKVFIPRDGYVFLDADYSQIELRVLAHMSEDANLIAAYRHAEDIHRITASQVFGVSPEDVTPLMRRNAKAVNFGIVYGISSFGLSQDLSISRKEAEAYIESYFASFPGIKSYLDRAVASAKETGYAVTLFGRRRPIPELSSGNFMQRSFGERIAMNSPIQGTAADIIKIAMNRVTRWLKEEGLQSRLILQVHDELLFEVAKEELDRVRDIVDKEMRQAARLSVDLEVELGVGENWLEAH